jgi:hypothetical protein
MQLRRAIVENISPIPTTLQYRNILVSLQEFRANCGIARVRTSAPLGCGQRPRYIGLTVELVPVRSGLIGVSQRRLKAATLRPARGGEWRDKPGVTFASIDASTQNR